MKKIAITKRDVTFFLLGALFLFIISAIWNWKDLKQGFNEGYKDAINKTEIGH